MLLCKRVVTLTNDVVKPKPVYSISMKGFGILGYFLFFTGLGISIIMYFQYGSDLTVWLVIQVIFIMGAFTGRIFEGNYHKRVMSHMTPGYQDLYRKMARILQAHDKNVGDLVVVECESCGCDTIISKFDEHLCQRCLEEKEKENNKE